MTGLIVDVQRSLGALSLRARLDTDAQAVWIRGPSGSGKSTFLRILAGTETRAYGKLSFRGEQWLDGTRNTPPERRGVAWSPQQALLFPHLSVARNLAFGAKDTREVRRIAAALGLERLLDRAPSSLSGGEAQRVSVGRALLRRAPLVLLDEPLAPLDDATAARVLRVVHEETRGSMLVLVSHDPPDGLDALRCVLTDGVLETVA